ncbi:unnamed protein product [Rhizophagus irregularis]|nr:unnamed protein product [Rhizophagus irregularis]
MPPTTEINEHIWKCCELLPHIRDTFRNLATIAQGILNKEADKLNLCITDTIKYSNIFRWSINDNTPITDNALLLLRSYVSEDLYLSFQYSQIHSHGVT